jgi:hypothetical protein
MYMVGWGKRERQQELMECNPYIYNTSIFEKYKIGHKGVHTNYDGWMNDVTNCVTSL